MVVGGGGGGNFRLVGDGGGGGTPSPIEKTLPNTLSKALDIASATSRVAPDIVKALAISSDITDDLQSIK